MLDKSQLSWYNKDIKENKTKKEVMNMKCAGELIAISLKVEEERKIREEQERLEQLKKEAEELEIIKKRTLHWCEKVGEELEKKARFLEPLEYTTSLSKNFRKDVYTFIEKVPSRYKNPKLKDCDYVIHFTHDIHLPTVTNFFEKYCFKVVFEKSKDIACSYGYGFFTAYTLTIKPAPQCF